MPFSDYLSVTDVAEFRALIEDTYPDTFEIVRETRTDSDEGGWTNAETVIGTGNCRLRSSEIQPQEQQIAERFGWEVAYPIDLPYATAVTPADRLRVNGTRTFEVGGVIKAGTWGFWATAVCKEIGS